MFTLYYSPGVCSMASHITLEESGAPYEVKPTLLPKDEHKSEAYLKVNPRGKVPALQIDGGQVLTENVAILHFLAKKFPQAKLLPSDPLEEARALSTMAWFSNTVHPSFTHIMRPERFSTDAGAVDKIKEAGRATFFGLCKEIDAMLKGKEWILGSSYSVCDPYALVFYGWGVRAGMPMTELVDYTAFKDRMLKRPAVRKVLEREESGLLKAA
jgi:glutathione S-transferase